MDRIRQARHRLADVVFTGNRSTIDAIRTAPPPSPLAPVDLSEPKTVHTVMDLAARIGDLLLSSGTGNSDTKAQILGITAAYGLYGCHVDITLNTITMFAPSRTGEAPTTAFRVVHRLNTDFSKLTEVDRLIRSIVAGATPLELAQKLLREIETAPPPYRTRYALLSWGGFAGAVALLLGGGLTVAVIATVTTVFSMFTTAWLASKSLPTFFQNFVGGFIATVPAAVIYGVGQRFNLFLAPSFVVASCIVALLAGLTLVQALQDGVTGAPVTSSARFFETILGTGAIISGIGVGIRIMDRLGVPLPPLDTTATSTSFANSTIQVVSGAAAAAFFCVACFCERRALIVASFTSLVASAAYYFVMLPTGFGAIAGITPLLPGLALYRGMYAMLNNQFVVGFSSLAAALATATALGAGVVLGEWVARRLRRPRILHIADGIRRPGTRRKSRVHWMRRRPRTLSSQWSPDLGRRRARRDPAT
ncbi:threonine/serine exporter family protein [Corynebacterium bovis]|uniref:threonine/serine exporter family protein n=1 Tax=Corynebacterium bovis TaxID=36808 RepID=UPI0031395B55